MTPPKSPVALLVPELSGEISFTLYRLINLSESLGPCVGAFQIFKKYEFLDFGFLHFWIFGDISGTKIAT